MDIKQSIEIMKSLADTSRLRVLQQLFEKPHYVEELAHRLDLAASTVSFHLKKLENVGLVYKVKEQYYYMYHIRQEIFQLSLQQFVCFENIEKYEQDERIEQYRQKVLKTFFRSGHLQKLPVQHKKRLIILREFLADFKPGTQYTEKEVNDCITKKFEDYCLIRRLMIEEGWMKRNSSHYWIETKQKDNNNGTER